MKKKSILLIAAILIILSVMVYVIYANCGLLFLVMIDDMNTLSKNDIFEMVDENHTVILQDINNGNFDNTKKIKGIEDISFSENYIDFFCGGNGIGSEMSYYGFYYSPRDSIEAMQNTSHPAGEALKPDGSGYSWQEINGDNRFYAEKIMDGFYYYEIFY